MKIKDRLFTLYQRSDGKYVIYTEPKIRTIFKSFYDAKIAIFDLLDEMWFSIINYLIFVLNPIFRAAPTTFGNLIDKAPIAS